MALLPAPVPVGILRSRPDYTLTVRQDQAKITPCRRLLPNRKTCPRVVPCPRVSLLKKRDYFNLHELIEKIRAV